MEKKCKNKKCLRSLPEGYKHKYCENCRNKQVKRIKSTGKAVAGVVAFALTIVSRERINPKK